MSGERRVTDEEWSTCLRVLTRLGEDPSAAHDREALERAVARVYKRARKERRKESGHARKAGDRLRVERILARRETGAEPPEPGAVRLEAGERACYVCQGRYRDLDARYHLLCPACARAHEEKRHQRADLSGRRAVVTGGRAGIGRATALKLLRDGACVVVATRYAEAARRSFAGEPDAAAIMDRLQIAGVDLRDLRSVERFAEAVAADGPVDILVNNAAVSVPYLDEAAARLAAGEPSPDVTDHREHHAWTYAVDEIPASELVDALVVNAAAPLVLVARLRAAMARSPFADRFVVNVTGLDGQFGRTYKSARHAHVNMSKAALNMLTRTAASELAEERIFMCSVDAGWVTHEGRASARRTTRAQGFLPPLDAIDAAARIYDPIVRGLAGRPVHGVLFKDYELAAF